MKFVKFTTAVMLLAATIAGLLHLPYIDDWSSADYILVIFSILMIQITLNNLEK